MEYHWYNVAEWNLTEREIHQLHIKIKKKKQEIIQKHLSSHKLPTKGKLMNNAKEIAREYFSNFYNN